MVLLLSKVNKGAIKICDDIGKNNTFPAVTLDLINSYKETVKKFS